MNLLLDLGNTRLKLARLRDGRVEPPAAFAWAEADFDARLRAFLEREGIDAATPAWLAAVAPDAAIARVNSVLTAHGLALPQRVHAQAEALGVRIAYAQPETLGVDRWLALLAARARDAAATLVVSVGSALTIDAIDDDGRQLGGLIAPPPEAMRAALLARAPRLDQPAGAVQRFAASTPDAIASGCVLAAAALIERSHAELAHRAGASPRLVLTGGGADALRAWIPAHQVVPTLVLDGLARWVAHRAP
jgi:type III pantothenate kinase